MLCCVLLLVICGLIVSFWVVFAFFSGFAGVGLLALLKLCRLSCGVADQIIFIFICSYGK